MESDSKDGDRDGSGIAKADKGLQELLEKTSDDTEICVACMLAPPDGNPPASMSPDQFSESVGKILRKVEQKVGYPAGQENVLKNIRSLVIRARPKYIRALLDQDEVHSALANEQAEDFRIPPIRNDSRAAE